MIKKHCLFCEAFVPIETVGEYDRFVGCSCAPGKFYNLRSDSYKPISLLPHQKKREMLHVVSAYIRELTDCDETVNLSVDDLESIVNSPEIPVTIEDKGIRLLQYLYRHSESPGEAVVIQPLSKNFNLTYSPNLQELVYILDKLSNDQLLIREGITFKLTDEGWSLAAASTGGKKLKPCIVLTSDEENLRTEWIEQLLPRIEQCGYLPRLLTPSKTQSQEDYSLELIADNKLVIADLTGQSPRVYLMGGYALGLGIPVIWTVNRNEADQLMLQQKEIRPMIWDTAEELAMFLQQRLIK